MLVPSEDWPDARSALGPLLEEAASIRAAVAFVTRSGVEQLMELIAPHPDLALELAARASDATEPEALLRLAERPNAEVSVVIGRHAQAFHPKLWLIETATELRVLAGSGNLTASGLTTNDEQFEIFRIPRTGAAAEAHSERYARLTRNALPLESVVNSAVWEEWLTLRRQQDRMRRQIAHLERRYFDREPLGDRSADKAVLIEDLQDVYDRTVAADLKRRDGGQYYPTRLLVAINRCRVGDRDPVRLVADIVKKETEGLNIIRDAGLFELTIESLVIDEGKPYHDLFSVNTIQIARNRLEE